MILLGHRQREHAKAEIDRAPDGYVVRITEPTRSLDQNAKLHAMLTDLARQVEWPVDGKVQKLTKYEWKDVMTAALKKEQRVAAGVDGGFVILGQRTSTMGKREFSDLVEIIYAFGSARDVVWSEPHPDKERSTNEA
jgi:hypothetical protein